MSADLINAVMFGVVAIVAIVMMGTYAIARVFVTGRGIFERRDLEEDARESAPLQRGPRARV